MDYFDFEEASHAVPSFNLDENNTDIIDKDDYEARAELEAQRVTVPNPFANTKAYGTTIKLKMINDREVEGILWDHNDGTEFPVFRAKEACDLCSRMGLDCFLASRGALITGCTCCISLYRECSFTHPQMPKGFIATMAGIAEDEQVCHGPMTTAKKTMRSFDDAKGRKTGSRFPRDAVKILKRWLSEHADHPYPNEREKEELKNLTGLRKSQVANWLANARRRGKVRSTSGPSSPILGAIDIPQASTEVYAELNPLDRWKISPPEHEPASITDIARAMSAAPIPRNSSTTSLHNSRASSRRTSSEEGSNWSAFRAPSVSSFETRESGNSDISFSSRSQHSKASLASSQDRRRRRRAPMTQRAVKQAVKSRSARLFQCTFCTDSFPAKYDWARHEKSLHLALERWICCPNGGTIDLPDGTRRCAFCPEKNPSTAHLEIHNYSTCQEKSSAERTFYRKDHLRQHLRLTHDVKMNPAMEAWKSTTDEIKSRCGFCPSLFTTWQQRVDHLAAHFRNGADMCRWSGDWGLESHIEKCVENSIPPYLIGAERATMDPYVARANTSPTGTTPGLSNGTSPDELESTINIQDRDTNCWHRLQEELIKFVLEQRSLGLVPTDVEIQDHGRMVIYGDPDPLDWTCADNPTWLSAFRYQMGIGPCPDDVNLQSTRYVPVTAPYVVKGGLKSKRPSTVSNNGIHKPSLQPDMTTTHIHEPNDIDMNLNLNLDTIDFDNLDLGDFEGLSFGGDSSITSASIPAIPTDIDIDNLYSPIHHQHLNQSENDILFGPLDFMTMQPQQQQPQSQKFSLSQQQQDNNDVLMSENDLDQLTGYMAGFNTGRLR